ncbi:HAD family phosphatase [Clostridiaceae bacterium NSJ-31]|uniref:HAD family phosphatase n=1 Tax=Ligaoa zhengdingensis TaxID=2763658 RepID=A0A926I4J7_9FIRM|nr:HAD family phosphatase [Ligaoa zhengdingensis]MBC8546306.1 HAD family phosphatase [Ligaoa zhengdingensis]
MKIGGVILDFNGTMFLDGEKQERAWRQFIRGVCRHEITDEEFRLYVHGRNNRFIMEYFLQKPLSDGEVAELIEQKEQIYRGFCLADPAPLHLTDGLPAFLDLLAERGIPHTIATASERNNVDFYIRTFDLGRWFDLDKLVYDDGTLRGKPDPDIYLRAAQRIGVEPGLCLVAEDAESGIQSAYRAGAGRIIAIQPEHKRELFAGRPEVDAVVGDFIGFERFLTD